MRGLSRRGQVQRGDDEVRRGLRQGRDLDPVDLVQESGSGDRSGHRPGHEFVDRGDRQTLVVVDAHAHRVTADRAHAHPQCRRSGGVQRHATPGERQELAAGLTDGP